MSKQTAQVFSLTKKQSNPIPEPVRNRHWLGQLSLLFEKRFASSRLTRVEHYGPLRVQRPFYPEGPDCCHVYLLHPPGGMVSGDELAIDIRLDEQTAALLTTPSAGKIYRGDNSTDSQLQKVTIEVDHNSSVEWLPQETIIFDGARGVLDTEIKLEEGARCFAWDMVCLGRPASAELFTNGSLVQRLMISQSGQPLFIERNCFVGGSDFLLARAGLSGHVVCGTAVTNHVFDPQLIDRLRENFAGSFVFTQLEKVFVMRYLGDSAEQCRLGFEKAWQQLRPEASGIQASSPRIWRT